MLNWYLGRQIKDFERSTGYDASYMRALLSAGGGALMRFHNATKVGKGRLGLSLEAWHVVRLVGIQAEDCGPCLQLSVLLAERDGVEPKVIKAIIQRDYLALPESLELAARFSAATLERAADVEELRALVVERFGHRGLVAIALSLAEVRLYPTVKYALGFGQACQRVLVDGQAVAPQLK